MGHRLAGGSATLRQLSEMRHTSSIWPRREVEFTKLTIQIKCFWNIDILILPIFKI